MPSRFKAASKCLIAWGGALVHFDLLFWKWVGKIIWSYFDNIVGQDSHPSWERNSFRDIEVLPAKLNRSQKNLSLHSPPWALNKHFFSSVSERRQGLLVSSSIFISNLNILSSPILMEGSSTAEHQQQSALYSKSLLPIWCVSITFQNLLCATPQWGQGVKIETVIQIRLQKVANEFIEEVNTTEQALSINPLWI